MLIGRYQKTESAIKATAEKTTSLLGGIGSAMSQKIGALKNTDSFRSMEERVSSAVSSVKVNVSNSRIMDPPLDFGRRVWRAGRVFILLSLLPRMNPRPAKVSWAKLVFKIRFVNLISIGWTP